MNGYPKFFLPSLMATTTLLFISGLLLLPSLIIFRLQWDIDWLMELPLSSGDLRLWTTAIHVVFGWLMVWFIGSLWTIHIRNHWRRKENITSGLVFMLFWALIIFSSLFIYYSSNETLSEYSSLVHSVLGMLVPLGLFIHRYHGKKSSKPIP
ncbi:hypothetical protein [Thiomicrorhabdus immobilis]|uniref:hypothetical protein n=1 Tax=Thiomicrorhabdus immobilis TaxID=2791037 RepID=UPI001F31027C|nr:hypothetical protein [Thiomicrorhabdus immobilis]